MNNTLKVGLVLTALTAAIVLFGRLVGGTGGMAMALGLAVLMNGVSYWFSDKIVLKMSGARPVGPQEAPDLYRMTESLAQRANIPMPRLYIIDDPQPNAFATGRSPSHGAVAVNTGLLSLLNQREIEGVVAHELGHIKHRDTLTMTVVATLAGALMLLVDIARFSAIFGGHDSDRDGLSLPAIIVMSLVGPIAAMVVQSAVSRAREFEADKTAAYLTGSPDGLIGALSKLERGARLIPNHSMSPQTAHMCIVNPFLGGAGGFLMTLFSTHPPTEKRIAALEQLRGAVPPQSAAAWR